MKLKKIMAAAMALVMVCGAQTALTAYQPVSGITANAEGSCYSFDSETGLLTLSGNVVLEEINGFELKKEVKSIKAKQGTVLPQSCNTLFSGYFNCELIDLSNADTSNVTNMSEMFYNCSSLTSLDLSKFDTSKVTEMNWMFAGCSSLASLDLSRFNTSNVTEMFDLFYKCSSVTSFDLSTFDTSKVTRMGGMFYECSSLKTLDVSSFDTSNATSMHGMFQKCSLLESLDLSGFDTSKVTDMSSMFENSSSLKTLDLSSFDTSKVEEMFDIFNGCSSLESLDLSSFDTSKVTYMGTMFYGCSSLKSLDLSRFDTSNVTVMKEMFGDCSSLESLDLSSFDTSKVTDMSSMFENCDLLASLSLGKDFGDITEKLELQNEGGWANKNAPETLISGSGEYATFANKGSGGNYLRIMGSIQPNISLGDPTGDGKVDAKDASFILVEYAKLSTGGESSLTAEVRKAADVNKDSKVDSKDASTVLQYYAYTSTGGTNPIEVYLGYEEASVTTTTSDISTETNTTEATTSTTATSTTQPTPSFDPNTYQWADIDYDDVDTNISNYTVDGTLYLGMIVKKLNDEFSKGYDISDLSEYSITDSSIYIRRLIRSNITNDSTMDYEFWYSKGEYSRFNPHFVRLNHNYEYLFSGSSNDLIRVDLNGQTAEFPKDEMRVLVRAMTGPFSGDPDALVEFGYTCSIDY